MSEAAAAFEPIMKLTNDLKDASRILTQTEARFLVDAYYQMQHDRIRAANQVKSMSRSGEPCSVLDWLSDQTATLEKQVNRALTAYAEADFVGRWAMSICGIGGVLSAGLLAHIDLEPWRCWRVNKMKPKCGEAEPCTARCGRERINTVGHIWNFAGVAPGVKWNKGEVRPFNAKLKVLVWKIGQSFVKVSSNKNDFYGKIYLQRKQYETAKNENADYLEQAVHQLETKKYGKNTEAYKHLSDGRLSPGQIQQRAERYAAKLFLAHWHEVAYRHRFGEMPPNPYPIAILNHSHRIEVPNYPF